MDEERGKAKEGGNLKEGVKVEKRRGKIKGEKGRVKLET